MKRIVIVDEYDVAKIITNDGWIRSNFREGAKLVARMKENELERVYQVFEFDPDEFERMVETGLC